MAYLLNGPVAIRANPGTDAPKLSAVSDRTVFGTGKTFTDDGGVVWINVLIPPGNVLDGWVRKTSCTEAPDPSPEPLDAEMFIRQCALVDYLLNGEDAIASFSVTADFIIARAIFETGLAQKKFSPAALDGPLRLLTKEWTDFIDSKLEAAKPFSNSDGIYPLAQVYGAAYRMHLDGMALSQILTGAAGDDPFVPSYLDLFHCYLSSPEGAAKLRDAEAKPNQAKPVSKLSDILPPDAIVGISARPALSSVKADMPVSDFFALTEPLLATLLNAAFAKLQQFAGDELPTDTGSPAPWLDVAKTQLGKKLPDDAATIRGYFTATDLPPLAGNTVPAWCGAFAAFCMKQAGLGTDIPKGAARASNWREWGTADIPLASNAIPKGAVVVLTEIPTKTGLHGHVGFFDGFTADGKGLYLVGGNQSGSVSRTSFALTRVAAARWRETQADWKGSARKYKLAAVGVLPKNRQWGDLIVDRFARAGLGKDHQLRAALASAITESKLDPEVSNVSAREESYGLFQCNRKGGLGQGYSPDQLKNPDFNIALVVKAARASQDFYSASTLEEASRAFVKHVERPKNTDAEVANRLVTAAKL